MVLTSQRELFPRLTADLRRFRKPPRLPPEPEAPGSSAGSPGEASGDGLAPGPAPLFPPLAAEVGVARARLAQLVRLAGGHCRRDTLWKRLFLLEPPGPDRLRLGGRLALAELEELLEAVHAKSIGDIDPQLVSSCGFQKGLGRKLGIPLAAPVEVARVSEVVLEQQIHACGPSPRTASCL